MILRALILLLLFLTLLPFPAATSAQGGTGVLSLDECIRTALQKSEDLAYYQAAVEGSRATLNSAQKDLYPSLSFAASHQRSKDSMIYPETGYTYALTLEQPIYQGGSLRSAVRLNKIAIQGAEQELAAARNALILNVNVAYFSLLKSMKLEEEAVLAVKRLESHLKDAKAFYEVGVIPKNDMLLSEVELAQGKQDLLQARNNLALARINLNLLLKRPSDLAVTIEAMVNTTPFNKDADLLIEQAHKQRPEITASQAAIDSALENIDLSQADYRPAIAVSATFQKTGNDILADEYDYGSPESQAAVASLTWNFWQWQQKHDKKAAAMANLTMAKRQMAALKDQITLQVKEAFLNAQLAEQNILVTDQAVDQAKENYRISQARYQSQLATSTEVLDAQTLLSRAVTNHQSALYDYQRALASLDWASGSLSSRSELPKPSTSSE